jgi:dTDP-4-dehydrorhamnose 3,5-epimerase-like enzyme
MHASGNLSLETKSMTEKIKFKQADTTLIEGVQVHRLRVIPDERGRLMEIMRRDDTFFTGFGQVYLTTVFPGVVKAWHYHRTQEDRFTCVRGMIKAVLCDDRDGSPTRGFHQRVFPGRTQSESHRDPTRGVPRLEMHRRI